MSILFFLFYVCFPLEKDALPLSGHSAEAHDVRRAQQLPAGARVLPEAPDVRQVQVPLLGLHGAADVHALRRRPRSSGAGSQ